MKRIISAGIIIYRKTREGPKFLLLYHGHGYWNFPKGKIEAEEKSWQAALREIREETGLKSTDLRLERGFKVYEKYIFRQQQEKAFKIVIFYLAETRKPQIVISYEHEGYGWFTFNEARKILPKKYRDIFEILKKADDFIRQKHKEDRRKI